MGSRPMNIKNTNFPKSLACQKITSQKSLLATFDLIYMHLVDMEL